MRDFQNDDLIRLLADDESSFRMLALHFLSEGYAQDATILPGVLAGWDRWGVELAFPELPMLSHVPIPAGIVAECCRRAADMVPGKKLTDTRTRCAGKLLEQVVCLPATELQPHQAQIANTASASKIFFRVDPRVLALRIAMLDLGSDELAQRLDSAIEALLHQSNNAAAFNDGLAALEALRFQHPQYLDVSAAITQAPPNDGAQAISFQLSMHSLIQFAQAGAEVALAKHLVDPREAIHSNAMEALVRIGSPLAAAHLILQFEQADEGAQRWIARGLQRVRADGLAEEVTRLRDITEEPALRLMLLVAEIRQFDSASLPRIADEIERVHVLSRALIDALKVYVRLFETNSGSRAIQQAFMSYLKRFDEDIQR
ncbi:MAG: hypothetical protein ABI557_07970 [Aureliella sp.]